MSAAARQETRSPPPTIPSAQVASLLGRRIDAACTSGIISTSSGYFRRAPRGAALASARSSARAGSFDMRDVRSAGAADLALGQRLEHLVARTVGDDLA